MNTFDESTFKLPGGWDRGSASILDCRSRIESVRRDNQTCADCSTKHPQWASLLLASQERLEGLGVLVCEQCAVHHHFELGKKRCFIKYLGYFFEWTHFELDILEQSGNMMVNGIYEATMTNDKNRMRDDKQQAKFIKNKYKKCRYRDDVAMKEALDLINSRAEKAKNRDQNTSRRSSDGSLLSLCSELDDSSLCIPCDLVDEEDFYLSCAMRSNSSCPSLNFNVGFPQVQGSASDPTLLCTTRVQTDIAQRHVGDRTPRKPRRRVSTDPVHVPKYSAPPQPQSDNKPILQRVASGPIHQSPKEGVLLRRAHSVVELDEIESIAPPAA